MTTLRRVSVVLMLLAGMLSGCTTRASVENAGLITILGTEPQNPLIPQNTNEIGGGWVLDRLFTGLTELDADGHVHYEAAESIELSDDHLRYTIVIRPGQVFSNGEPVTSHSFVDAWNYGALSTNAQLQSSAFEKIQGYDEVSSDPPRAQTMSGLQVVDDLTFTVILVQPAVDFRIQLAWNPYYPLPSVAYRNIRLFGENPIGNGPYVLVGPGAWQHNVRIDFKPSPTYHGFRTVHNQGVSFIFYQSLEAGYADLVGGNLDFHYSLPSNALGIYRRDLGERFLRQPSAQNLSLAIPEYLPHWGGEEGRLRRRAVVKAINRQKICDVIYYGARTPSQDFTSPSLPDYDPHSLGSEVLAYDPGEAKRLWARADALSPWEGTLQLFYNFDGGHKNLIDAMASYISRNIGVPAQGAPLAGFKEVRDLVVKHTMTGPFRSGWLGDYPTALNFLEPQFVTGAASNDGSYSNKKFDQLLRQAESAANPDDAQEFIAQAQKLLFEDLPMIPMLAYTDIQGYSARLKPPQGTWNGAPDVENFELKKDAV